MRQISLALRMSAQAPPVGSPGRHLRRLKRPKVIEIFGPFLGQVWSINLFADCHYICWHNLQTNQPTWLEHLKQPRTHKWLKLRRTSLRGWRSQDRRGSNPLFRTIRLGLGSRRGLAHGRPSLRYHRALGTAQPLPFQLNRLAVSNGVSITA